jgi:hypothetical protein
MGGTEKKLTPPQINGKQYIGNNRANNPTGVKTQIAETGYTTLNSQYRQR